MTKANRLKLLRSILRLRKNKDLLAYQRFIFNFEDSNFAGTTTPEKYINLKTDLNFYDNKHLISDIISEKLKRTDNEKHTNSGDGSSSSIGNSATKTKNRSGKNLRQARLPIHNKGRIK
jgi:hypothetical protein